MKTITILLFLFPSLVLASSLDERLAEYIKTFKLKPVHQLDLGKDGLYHAGKRLFNDKLLSGNRNISCADCHHPEKGTGDGVALSLGQGSLNTNRLRYQWKGAVLKRHSPVLYNLGHSEFRDMFWDGRVSFRDGILRTPEPRLNGANPEAAHVANVLSNALEAQVIFPILSREEMRGWPGENELADESDNLKAWELVVKRIRSESKEVFAALQKSFPGREINIGHVARALGRFVSVEFQVWDTPYDRYLKGDLEALDERSKKGMRVFFERGRCGNCHWGKHLTNHAFQSAGVPALVKEGAETDRGVMELTGNPRHAFLFKNPQLRNVALSAPYMHNGSFQTLRQVIEHYNKISESLEAYLPDPFLQFPYRRDLEVNTQSSEDIFRSVFQPFLRRGLRLSEEEMGDLEHFLRKGLTDAAAIN